MRRIVIALVVIALLGLGFYWFSRPKPIPVELKEVTEGKVEAYVPLLSFHMPCAYSSEQRANYE